MKVKTFLIIAVFASVWCIFAHAQKKPVDLIPAEKNPAKQLNLYKKVIDSLSTEDFDQSLKLSRQAIALAEKNPDKTHQGDLLRLIANVYYFKGKLDSAGFYYYRSLSILEKENSPLSLAELYNNLGRYYRKTKDFPRALKNYDSAFSIFSAQGNLEGTATIYNESGVVYEYMGKHDEAVNRYRKSLEIQKKRGDLTGQGYALEFIGGNYVLQEKYALAEQYLKESLSLAKKTNDYFATALRQNVVGHLFMKQDRLEAAESAFLESNRIAENLKYLDLMKDNYHQLADINRKMHRSEEAFDYLEKYKIVDDSLFSIAKAKQIEELSVQYETLEKDREILRNKNLIFRRNIFIASLAALLIAGFAVAFSLFRHRKKNEKIKLQKEILHQQDLATKAVMTAEDNERKRMASHLHDGVAQLLGAANMNVETLSEYRDDDEVFGKILNKTKSILDDAITDVRSLSHQMMPNMLIKSSLGKALQDLTEKSNSPKLKIQLKMDGLQDDLDKNIQVVMYRVIQESINNTLKHAQATEIDISLKQSWEFLETTISDNGIGFNINEISSRSSGLGLENIKFRVELLKGSMQIVSGPGKGTEIQIKIPLSA